MSAEQNSLEYNCCVPVIGARNCFFRLEIIEQECPGCFLANARYRPFSDVNINK